MSRRKQLVLATVLPLLSLVAVGRSQDRGGDDKPIRVDFESLDQGRHAPSGFTADVTGGGHAGEWRIEDATPAPRGTGGRRAVVRRTDDKSELRFPVCVYDDFTGRDVDVTVQFMPLKGTVDQAGGVVVRYRDANNYYVLSGSALENSVRFYKVVDGRREQLADRAATIPLNRWHEFRLVARGGHFEAFHDGNQLFEADDDAIKEAGKVGLWTRADSQTMFDDLVIKQLDEK